MTYRNEVTDRYLTRTMIENARRLPKSIKRPSLLSRVLAWFK